MRSSVDRTSFKSGCIFLAARAAFLNAIGYNMFFYIKMTCVRPLAVRHRSSFISCFRQPPFQAMGQYARTNRLLATHFQSSKRLQWPMTKTKAIELLLMALTCRLADASPE